MGLTRERKLLVGVLGVAAAGLVIDQVILTPAEASAAPLTSTAQSAAEPVGEAAGEAVPIPPTPVSSGEVTKRLRLVALQMNVYGSDAGNAFELPEGWAQKINVSTEDPNEQAAIETGLRLTSVMPNQGLASISGRRYSVGALIGEDDDQIADKDRYRLIDVGKDSVIVERYGRETTLFIGGTRPQMP